MCHHTKFSGLKYLLSVICVPLCSDESKVQKDCTVTCQGGTEGRWRYVPKYMYSTDGRWWVISFTPRPIYPLAKRAGTHCTLARLMSGKICNIKYNIKSQKVFDIRTSSQTFKNCKFAVVCTCSLLHVAPNHGIFSDI